MLAIEYAYWHLATVRCGPAGEVGAVLNDALVSSTDRTTRRQNDHALQELRRKMTGSRNQPAAGMFQIDQHGARIVDAVAPLPCRAKLFRPLPARPAGLIYINPASIRA